MSGSLRGLAQSAGTMGHILRRVESLLPSSAPAGRRVSPPEARERPHGRHSVSVVVPCYNYGHFLEQCVASALGQEGVDVEVVIVDDVSTDDSLAVARRLAAADERVHVVAHEVNAGHGAAFNSGLARASGEFAVKLDADDLLPPGSLARAVALFESHPEVGLVYGHPRHFTGDLPPRAITTLRGWTVWAGADWVEERCRRGVNCITTPEAMVRMSVLRAVGPMDNSVLHHAQDLELWLRVAARSDVGRVVGPDQALHRDHPASMSATMDDQVLTDMRERLVAFRSLVAAQGHALADPTRLQRLAEQALAAEALNGVSRAYDAGRVDVVPVRDLEAFAGSIGDRIHRLPAWGAMRLRQRLGQRLSRRLFVLSVARRRLVSERDHVRWVRTGL